MAASYVAKNIGLPLFRFQYLRRVDQHRSYRLAENRKTGKGQGEQDGEDKKLPVSTQMAKPIRE